MKLRSLGYNPHATPAPLETVMTDCGYKDAGAWYEVTVEVGTYSKARRTVAKFVSHADAIAYAQSLQGEYAAIWIH